MKVHVLQHVSFEGFGSIGAWLEEKSAAIRYTKLFENQELPAIDTMDILIIMGGPMSVNDEAEFPWLIREKEFIRSAVKRGIPILGICLGAQLIASAMGASVYRNPVKEIGWFPIRRVPVAGGNLQLPEECIVFHWHGETFDLPEGAVHLAESAACVNQAFQLNRNVIGLQFHMETTVESANALIENCREELIPGPYIQSEQMLRSVPPSAYRSVNAIMNEVLSYLAS
jgi:GMP synthase-like glutamine amidotransferase